MSEAEQTAYVRFCLRLLNEDKKVLRLIAMQEAGKISVENPDDWDATLEFRDDGIWRRLLEENGKLLSFVERKVNPAKRESYDARICVANTDESNEAAISRHRLEYGRVPVVVVSAKKATS